MATKTEKIQKKPVEEIEMNDIPTVEMPKIDVTKYIGRKAKVISAKVVPTQFGRAFQFETAVIATEGTKEKPIEIKASRLLTLHQAEDGEWGIGAGSMTEEFFKKYKITNHKDMIGKEVIVESTKPKNGVQFLTFN